MSISNPHLILASGSPRRKALLDQMLIKYKVEVAGVDESVLSAESPEAYVCRIAEKKAQSVASKPGTTLPVLAADTVVVLEGKILGKPGSPESVREMLLGLSGNTHEVFTSVVLISSDGVLTRRLNVSTVSMARLDMNWLDAYCQLEESLDKAGAYAIQGLAAQWIDRLDGSYSGVMGLPLFETMELLRHAGIPTWSVPSKECLSNDQANSHQNGLIEKEPSL
jgi:septum formation protein